LPEDVDFYRIQANLFLSQTEMDTFHFARGSGRKNRLNGSACATVVSTSSACATIASTLRLKRKKNRRWTKEWNIKNHPHNTRMH
jgi:hypothetical protein